MDQTARHPRRSLIRVLEHDRGLVKGLARSQVEEAASSCIAPAFVLRNGRWRPPISALDDVLGLLVLDGLVCRHIVLGSRHSVELLGPGELLRPWTTTGEQTVPSQSTWTVIESGAVALLDRDFHRSAARWPEITSALLDRALQRSRSLALRLAIAQLPRLAERLHLVLWHLADRWGRVERDAVVLPLRLSHQILADLVCAQRPSVSHALKELASAKLVLRRSDGGWTLCGTPPSIEGMEQQWSNCQSKISRPTPER